jgi:hypothetical protein
MTDTNNNKPDYLLEEYKQVYDQYRHLDNVAVHKEAVFAVASFGILALVINKDLNLWGLFGASLASLGLFLYHTLACERMYFHKEIAKTRLREIEEEIYWNRSTSNQNEIPIGSPRFQACYKEYENNEEKKRIICGRSRIRHLRWLLFALLFILWMGVGVATLIEFPYFQKSHPHSGHTVHKHLRR